VDTSTALTTLPGASRPLTGATPESSTATSTPAPVRSWSQVRSASITRAARNSDPKSRSGSKSPLKVCNRTGWLAVTDTTPGVLCNRASADAGTVAANPLMMARRRPTTPPSRPTSSSTPGPAPGVARTITGTRWPVGAALPAPVATGSTVTATAVSNTRATSRIVLGLRMVDAAVRMLDAP
jgi:hypothetical protein